MSKQTPGRLNIVNRDEFPVFQPSPVIPYKIKRRIKSVKMKMVDHEEKYRKAKEAGLPVDVVNSDIFVNGNQKPDDGIFSSLFGSDTTEDRPLYT